MTDGSDSERVLTYGNVYSRVPRAFVVVPPGFERPLLRFIVRALTREAREDGGTIPPGIAPFLAALQAHSEAGPVARERQPEDGPETIEETGMATVAQLAEDTGHPRRTLQRWAAAGRVRARRIGRTWLIDPNSLRAGYDSARRDHQEVRGQGR